MEEGEDCACFACHVDEEFVGCEVGVYFMSASAAAYYFAVYVEGKGRCMFYFVLYFLLGSCPASTLAIMSSLMKG